MQGLSGIPINSRSHSARTVPNMNASDLIKLFGFFLATGVLASQRLSKNCLHIRLYELMNTGAETLDQVQAIVENADEDFDTDFDGINFLDESCNPEVFEYVLSKSVNMEPSRRAMDIRKILGRKLSEYREGICQLVPGEAAYAIAMTCLNEIKGDNYPESNYMFAYNFGKLIEEGHLDLIKKLVEAGFKLSTTSIIIRNIKNNIVETINYIVEHGYDLSNDFWSIHSLMESRKLSPSDFELYLDHGLSLELNILGFNLLELVFQIDNREIAMALWSSTL